MGFKLLISLPVNTSKQCKRQLQGLVILSWYSSLKQLDNRFLTMKKILEQTIILRQMANQGFHLTQNCKNQKSKSHQVKKGQRYAKLGCLFTFTLRLLIGRIYLEHRYPYLILESSQNIHHILDSCVWNSVCVHNM